MVEVATALVMFGAFLAIYEALRRRAAAEGPKPAVRWGWLAVVAALAAVALVIGSIDA